jgi:hypothetical protein
MAAEPLSDLLKTVRLTGAVFFEVAAEDPWAIGSPAPEQILPKILPRADHLNAYHVVTSGRCFATTAEGQAITLEAGQVIMFTSGQPHVLSSQPNMPADPLMPDALEVATSGEKPCRVNFGSGAASARLVWGFLACDTRPYNPLNLPTTSLHRQRVESMLSWDCYGTINLTPRR